MKKYFLLFGILFSTCNLKAQTSTVQDTLRIIASGTAYTKDKANNAALRNALEKGAGVYISSETIIQNNELVFDESASLSNGTIASYDIIESDFSDKTKEYSVTVNANIIKGKFIDLIKSKGININFDGASFAQNVKLNNYYQNEEPKILMHFEDKLDFDTYFNFFDKKILAEEPKIYSFVKTDYQLLLEKDWHSHRNNDLLYSQRKSKNNFIEISGKKYVNPFLFQFKKSPYSFNEYFYFKDIHDSISNVINSWKALFNNKPNWSPEEIKNYSNYKENDIYDWNDYTEFKVFDSMNNCFNSLNNELKANSGNYVLNITPLITANKNYNNFIETLKKILDGICLNKNPDFSKKSYEEKFGKTYSLFIYENKNGQLLAIEYVLRNYESLRVYDRMMQNIGQVSSGKAVINWNLIKSNLGRLDNYIVGLEIESNSKQELTRNYPGLISNPQNLEMIFAQQDDYRRPVFFNLAKFSISQFFDLNTIEKLKDFTIDNPPIFYNLPKRPNGFFIDAEKKINISNYQEINNKLNQLYKKLGVELFVVINNNNYGIVDIDMLSKTYGYEWEIGGKEKYQGIIININPAERKLNVRYGSGLDNKLNTVTCNEAITLMSKELKDNNYLAAVNKAIDFFESKLINIQ